MVSLTLRKAVYGLHPRSASSAHLLRKVVDEGVLLHPSEKSSKAYSELFHKKYIYICFSVNSSG